MPEKILTDYVFIQGEIDLQEAKKKKGLKKKISATRINSNPFLSPSSTFLFLFPFPRLHVGIRVIHTEAKHPRAKELFFYFFFFFFFVFFLFFPTLILLLTLYFFCDDRPLSPFAIRALFISIYTFFVLLHCIP